MVDPVFERAVAIVLAHEGGYVDDPTDRGGETKYGISKRSYPDLDIDALTVEDAKAIYERDFWRAYHIDRLPEGLSPKVLDMAVLLGPGTAIRLLQQALAGLGAACAADGRIGDQTAGTCRSVDAAALLDGYRSCLADHFQAIVAANPSQQRFLAGWLKRCRE